MQSQDAQIAELEGAPTLAPGHCPAKQNCRIATMAHFMVNQRGFVSRLRDGHETRCTDRLERSIVISPVWKDRFPRSIHGKPQFLGERLNYKTMRLGFVELFLTFADASPIFMIGNTTSTTRRDLM